MKPGTILRPSMGVPRQDGAFIRRVGFMDARCCGPVVGEVCEQVGGVAPLPPPRCLLSRGGGGGLWLGPMGALEVPMAPPWGTALSAALPISPWRGIDGDSLPLARLPLQDAHHNPELDAAANEILSKGLCGVLRGDPCTTRALHASCVLL